MAETSFTVDKEKLEVRMERVFDASIEKVYQALSTREKVAEWWGGTKYKTEVDKFDFRVGGGWRFVQSDDSGETFAFRGEYKEIIPNQKIVNTFEFEPWEGYVLTETHHLEDLGGKTRLLSISKYSNLDDLQRMVDAGMENGARSSWERLAEEVEA